MPPTTAMLAQATARPWMITEENDTGPNDEGYWEWLQAGPARVDILHRDAPEEARANAALIVHAVNCHEALLAALKELRARFHRCCLHSGSDRDAADASCAAADAAIADAEGTAP
jgi:hypothetical protein